MPQRETQEDVALQKEGFMGKNENTKWRTKETKVKSSLSAT